MKILCVFGKYNYGDPTRGLGYEYCNFIPALERLGHQVVFFDSKDRTIYPDFASLNRSLIQTVLTEKPDLILAVQMLYEVWIETWQLIRAWCPSIVVNWATDDSWRYESFSRYIAPAFDLMCTTYPEALAKYKRDGMNNVLLTQWATNAAQLQTPLPAAQCKYPVTFIGTAHGNRAQIIQSLRQQGIPIQCFGYGWETGAIASELIPKIIRESVISLNLANSAWIWDKSLVPHRHNQIKARVFEVPGAGGFLLTENAPGLENYYCPNNQIAIFNDIHELAARIRHYLSHPNERDALANAGFQRTRVEHTYDQRMRHIIEQATQRKISSPTQHIVPNWQTQIAILEQRYQTPVWQKQLRDKLVSVCILLWGNNRGLRAARRLTFEISWRLLGKHTYTVRSIPGRLFYGVS